MPGFSLSALATRAAPPTGGMGISTPIMGYNTYNDVACSPNATYVSSTIDALVSRGFRDAGYTFFQIDCGWQGTTRTNNPYGAIDYDTNNFPQGLKPISDKARSKGLTFSLYSDAGVRACDTIVPSPRLGSYGHEEADAKLFASWNVEYVKYDYCYADGPNENQNAPKDPRKDYVDRYGAMWRALQNNKIGRMLVCQWGTPYISPPDGDLEGPVDWTKGISTSFRLSDDINDDWAAVVRILNQSIHIAKSGKTGPGHFADADMLEVGSKKLTLDQQRTHFAYWAMIKSALMIGLNPQRLGDDAVALLQNRDLIAINQDALGKPIELVERWTNDRDLYRGPLANGDEAVLVVNWKNQARTDLGFDLAQLGIAKADVKDLWTGQVKRGVTGRYVAGTTTGALGSLPLRLSNIVRAPSKSGAAADAGDNVKWVEAESGTLSGGAKAANCSGCSGARKVGNLGAGASVTLSNLSAPAETSTLLFDYINAEVGYLGGQGPNARTALISVNDGPSVQVSFPLSGYDWDASVAKSYRVQLAGFKRGAAANNKITITADKQGFAPDLDRVGVVQQ
ncbi:related to Alpha-N-acetylgalactosaminidase precursor [Pseudozyma flocculosa]|nr:related to Alpha-N-acetylgalactosaminidase precursor [Pseudozyma flocculosa]